jgi:hypothetical protein
LRRNLLTMQIAIPALSNPYDIAEKDSLLCVAFNGMGKILVYAQADGSKRGEIGVSGHADSADGLAETGALSSPPPGRNKSLFKRIKTGISGF